MGLLLFGLFLIMFSTILLYAMISNLIEQIKSKTTDRLTYWGVFIFSLVTLYFFALGTAFMTTNNYNFNKHIKLYQRGKHYKVVIYDSLSNEREFVYKLY